MSLCWADMLFESVVGWGKNTVLISLLNEEGVLQNGCSDARNLFQRKHETTEDLDLNFEENKA